jgi:hypothetical protein
MKSNLHTAQRNYHVYSVGWLKLLFHKNQKFVILIMLVNV